MSLVSLGERPVLLPRSRHDVLDREDAARNVPGVGVGPAQGLFDCLQHHSQPTPREQTVERQAGEGRLECVIVRPFPGIGVLTGEVVDENVVDRAERPFKPRESSMKSRL